MNMINFKCFYLEKPPPKSVKTEQNDKILKKRYELHHLYNVLLNNEYDIVNIYTTHIFAFCLNVKLTWFMTSPVKSSLWSIITSDLFITYRQTNANTFAISNYI